MLKIVKIALERNTKISASCCQEALACMRTCLLTRYGAPGVGYGIYLVSNYPMKIQESTWWYDKWLWMSINLLVKYSSWWISGVWHLLWSCRSTPVLLWFTQSYNIKQESTPLQTVSVTTYHCPGSAMPKIFSWSGSRNWQKVAQFFSEPLVSMGEMMSKSSGRNLQKVAQFLS